MSYGAKGLFDLDKTTNDYQIEQANYYSIHWNYCTHQEMRPSMYRLLVFYIFFDTSKSFLLRNKHQANIHHGHLPISW